jgi:hypothetical protein
LVRGGQGGSDATFATTHGGAATTTNPNSNPKAPGKLLCPRREVRTKKLHDVGLILNHFFQRLGPHLFFQKLNHSRASVHSRRHVIEQNELGVEEEALLVKFLKECLGKKRLYRVKDVVYDKDTGRIREIPALVFNKQARHFTLKRTDKRVSTLKSLPPKKGALKASSKSDEGGEAESSTD